jgi:transposase-like protein
MAWFDEKILSMYGLGLSTAAIQENLKDIYNVDVSPELISRVTDEVKGLVESTTGGVLSGVVHGCVAGEHTG